MLYNRCVVNGVFDLFHVGHIRLFKRAKDMFNEVIATIDSDDFTEKVKRRPIFNENERLEIIKSCRYVDNAFIVDDKWGPYAENPAMIDDFMKKNNIDAIFVAADDEEYVKHWFSHLQSQQKVIVVPRTKDISTTHIIKVVNGEIEREIKK